MPNRQHLNLELFARSNKCLENLTIDHQMREPMHKELTSIALPPVKFDGGFASFGHRIDGVIANL